MVSSMSPSPITCSGGSGTSGDDAWKSKPRRSSEVSANSGSEERGKVPSSINRSATGGPSRTRSTICASSSCFTVKMSDSQVPPEHRLSCNNNISNKSIVAPFVPPSDEDNSYAMAIKNSSPCDPEHSVLAFSDSGDDEDDLTDRETGTPCEGKSCYCLFLQSFG